MEKYDFAIIGGGWQGLTLAYFLTKQKKKVIVLEKEKELGGVLSGFKVNNTFLEKYYHHFFPTDYNLFGLIKELNLSDKIIWKKVKSGFDYKNTIYPFSSPMDLLLFKPLSLKDKIILAFFLLKLRRTNPEELDSVSAKEWIIKNSNYNIYKKLFETLIVNKFGEENIDNVSASWFVARIKLRSASTGSGETLGYLSGGFNQLIDSLKNRIEKQGSKIYMSTKFIKFNLNSNKIISASTNRGKFSAANFISTIPPELVSKNLPESYREKVAKICYQGSVCVILGLKRKISSIYWINLIGMNSPFKAVIEHTCLEDKKKYGCNIIYLASYYPTDSKIWNTNNKEILDNYIKSFTKEFKINKDDIILAKIFKEKYAGVIADKGYLKNMLPFKTPISNLSVIGMFNCYPERGLEIQAKMAKQLIKMYTPKKDEN